MRRGSLQFGGVAFLYTCTHSPPPANSLFPSPFFSTQGTYYFGGATPLDCMPCPKGQTTIGCGATSVNQCHKPCGAGSFYNVQSKACQKCPAGTFFPGTGFGKTQLLETTECIPCPGSTKVGATTCRAYAKNATHNNGGKAWKKARV